MTSQFAGETPLKTAVIIPVKNEAQGLDALLTTLRAQLSPQDEIVLVDAGSTDETQDIARRHAKHDERVRVIVSLGAFPGKGRNIGVAATSADIIAQVDGGNMPNEVWLEEIRAPILRGEADYVTGNSKPLPLPRRLGPFTVEFGNMYAATLFRAPELRVTTKTRNHAEGEPAAPAGGDSVAYRRWVWEQVGGFPEWLRFGADPIFVRKVIQVARPRFAFADKAVVWWQLGPTVMRVFERHSRQQQGNLRTPQGLRKNLPKVLVYLSLLPLLAAGLIHPALLAAPGALYAFFLAQQSFRSIRSFTRGYAHEGISVGASKALIILLEGLFVFARIHGSARGLLLHRKNLHDWTTRVDGYLQKRQSS